MKNSILLLISLILISCSTQKVLKTDTQQDIDLSGRWNDTDAEIASSELFNSLLASTWLKEYQGESNLKARIEIVAFDSNFKGGGEKLNQYFIEYTKKNSSFEFVENRKEKLPEFLLNGKITAEEFVTERQNYIDYKLNAQLKNLDGEIQWEDSTTIKKYLKD